MKLLRLKVDGFGPLQGEFHFDPGRVTLVVDDNESGKSSLLAAVTAALYGLEGDHRTHRVLTPLERWRPWNGGAYRVELEFESGGTRYTVRRDFERGEVAVWNDRGQEVTSEFREGKDEYPVGKKLLELDEAEFEKCVLIRQSDLEQVVPGDEKARRASTLRARLENAADTRVGDTNASEALQVLEQAVNGYTCDELGATVKVDSALQRLETKQGLLETELKTLEHDLARIAGPLEELARLGEEERESRAALTRLDAERRGSLAGDVRRALAEDEARRAALEKLRAEAEALAPVAHLPGNAEAELRETVARCGEAQRNLETLESRRREEVTREQEKLEGAVKSLAAYATCGAEDADRCVALAAELRRIAIEDSKLKAEVFRLRDALAGRGYEPERIQLLTGRFAQLAEKEHRLLRSQAELAFAYQTEVATLEQTRTESTEMLRTIDALRAGRRLPGWLLVALGLGTTVAGGLMAAMRRGEPSWLWVLGTGIATVAAGLVVVGLGGGARRTDRDLALRRLSDAQARLNQLRGQRAETEVSLGELSRAMGYRDSVGLMHDWTEYARLLEDSSPLRSAQEQLATLETRRRETVAAATALLERAGGGSPDPERLERVATDIRRWFAVRQRQAELERSWSWIDEEKRVAEAAAAGLRERAVRILQSAGLTYDPERPWSEQVQELAGRVQGRARLQVLHEELIPQAERGLLPEAEVAQRREQLALLESERDAGEEAPAGESRPPLEIEAEARKHRDTLETLQRRREDLRVEVEEVWRRAHTERPEKLAERERVGAALVRARRFKQAVELARDTIQRVAVDTHRRWAEFLGERVGELLGAFGARVEQLRFGEDLDFSLRLAGQQVSRGKAALQLSTGARDQLYLAVRLAVGEYLSRGREPLPLLVDDAFATSDDQRARAGMRLLLEHFGQTHQVVVVTCHRRRHELFAELDQGLYAERVRWVDARTARVGS